ncbi:unnamed protein product [Plutella xylostella]|uniref:(diamondback moth) hypothetical protein n=1 Tax=Plutella xylostella TaxID=51655 RepID=A0A8S4FNL2_PLUXY|nr:unnamed protein product [Plutella xylostella]
MPLTSAERQRRYRERLKNNDPKKWEEHKKKEAQKKKQNYKKVSELSETEKSARHSTNHSPEAIWAHLKPILTHITRQSPEIDSIHIFSDGPTTQYRQKKNFFLFTTIIKDFAMTGTWNFFEASHGKGAADGIGGSVKRLLDKKVSYGNDILDAESALTLLKDETSIKLFCIAHDSKTGTWPLPLLHIFLLLGLYQVRHGAPQDGATRDGARQPVLATATRRQRKNVRLGPTTRQEKCECVLKNLFRKHRAPAPPPLLMHHHLSVKKLLTPMCKKKISAEQKKKIDRDLLDLCVDGFHPFTLVEERAFRKFCRWIPGYVLPSRKTLSNSLLDETYNKVREQVQSQINRDVQTICLTTDLWTSRITESYIAVTGHYLTEDLQLKTVLLGCCHFSGNHTAANIGSELRALVDIWGLTGKVNFVVSDNAANVVKGVKDSGWKHFGCFAHTLNLVVEDAIKPCREKIDKVKKVVGHYKKSTVSSERLIKYQVQQNANCQPLRLIQDVETRWNSTFYMLRRFVQLQEAVRATMALVDRDLPQITADDWKVYQELVLVLRPFEELTSTMSGEKYVTASSVIVMTRCLQEACRTMMEKTDQPTVNEVALLLKVGISERLKGIEQSGTFSLCTFLDPRFKTQAFSDPHEAQKTKERVRRLVANIISEDEIAAPEAPSTSTMTTQENEFNPWPIFDKLVGQSVGQQGTPTSKAIKEVDMYLADERLPRKTQAGTWNCPLQWWKNHRAVYPNLTKLYIRHCNIVSTSVPCERMFSKTGLIINQRRTRLQTSKVEKIMFLNVFDTETRDDTRYRKIQRRPTPTAERVNTTNPSLAAGEAAACRLRRTLKYRARLLASSTPQSGYWLNAYPSANLGTLLDRTTLAVAISLRLGLQTNEPHRCRCGEHADRRGHHGLSCGRSAGRIARHAALNDTIRRALASANVPATLEPSGIMRDDGKRPDGMSLVPWKRGRLLVWDATCVDTLAPSHLPSTSREAGAAAGRAEMMKGRKYASLGEGYMFVPFGVETLGPWGLEARQLFKDISTRLIEVSRDPRAGSYLAQRLSIAIQRGNAASVLGTLPDSGSDLASIFFLV